MRKFFNTIKNKAKSDVVQQANDIINGKADYYDVNEAVNNNG